MVLLHIDRKLMLLHNMHRDYMQSISTKKTFVLQICGFMLVYLHGWRYPRCLDSSHPLLLLPHTTHT